MLVQSTSKNTSGALSEKDAKFRTSYRRHVQASIHFWTFDPRRRRVFDRKQQSDTVRRRPASTIFRATRRSSSRTTITHGSSRKDGRRTKPRRGTSTPRRAGQRRVKPARDAVAQHCQRPPTRRRTAVSRVIGRFARRRPCRTAQFGCRICHSSCGIRLSAGATVSSISRKI